MDTLKRTIFGPRPPCTRYFHVDACKPYFICAVLQEPLRSLALGNQGARSNALISCHDFLPGAKDGVDTLVGMSDGQGAYLDPCVQAEG
eukprot:207953-Pelagomonas_calceolata.AAC.1